MPQSAAAESTGLKTGTPTGDEVGVVLRYAGRDVDDGTIDVDDMLAALNGFSSAFYKLADRESDGAQQKIRVTGISRSSANVHLEIFQLAHDHPLVASAVTGGLAYVGKKIDNNNVVIVNGVNARLPVERDVFDLFEEGTIDADLDKMTSPLREDAIDAFEIRRDGDATPDLHLDASDRPYFARSHREATTTAELTMNGTMNTISKSNNSGIFVAENGRRIRYRFTNESKLAELYRMFAHLGPVKVRCTAKLDENLDVISIDISDVEAIQARIRFADTSRPE